MIADIFLRPPYFAVFFSARTYHTVSIEKTRLTFSFV